MWLARKSIFKLSKVVLFENRKVVDFDEQTKSKRGGERTFPCARMHLMTQIVTNYKGFKRTLPSSELYVHENHENPLKNSAFNIEATEPHLFFGILVLEV